MKTAAPGNQNIFELEKIISKSINNFKELAQENKVDLQITHDLASYTTLLGDGNKLEKLLNVILENTLTNSKATKVVFSIRQLLHFEKELLIEFLLEDNGCIKQRAGNISYCRSVITAKNLIDAMDGKSELTVAEGNNTAFKFIIKCQCYIPPEEVVEINGDKLTLKGKRILLAEDNEINQKVILQMLEKEGIITDLAANGKEAVDLFENNKYYDLVLMDIMMPFMDGLQATNYIRKKCGSNVPVIAMSAMPTPIEQAQCNELGINKYLSKPFTRKELLLQLHLFLDGKTVKGKEVKLGSKKIAV
ncbi:MAG TPA: response regulator [Flavisolibacter sp.]|nr:response regulator [Flavisolibacter sp.]